MCTCRFLGHQKVISVRPYMSEQITTLSEPFLAGITFEGLLPSMYASVAHDVTSLLEGFVAEVAFVCDDAVDCSDQTEHVRVSPR